jgi:hypothetical protein
VSGRTWSSKAYISNGVTYRPAVTSWLARYATLTCHEGMGPGPHVPLVVIEFFRQGTQDEELSYHLDDKVC